MTAERLHDIESAVHGLSAENTERGLLLEMVEEIQRLRAGGDIEAYQLDAARTLTTTPDEPLTYLEPGLAYHGVQLAERAGALVDYIKKGVFHRHGVDRIVLHTMVRAVDEALVKIAWPSEQVPEGYHRSRDMYYWNTLGLAGEAGEVAHLMLQPHLNADALEKECGDCVWYVAAHLTKIGRRLATCLHLNIEKLKARYPQGRDAARSQQRQD